MTIEISQDVWGEWKAEADSRPLVLKTYDELDAFLEDRYARRVKGGKRLFQVFHETEFFPLRCWEIYGVQDKRDSFSLEMNALLEMYIGQGYFSQFIRKDIEPSLSAPEIKSRLKILSVEEISAITDKLGKLHIPFTFTNEEMYFGIRGGSYWTVRYGDNFNYSVLRWLEDKMPKQWSGFEAGIFELVNYFEMVMKELDLK